MSLHLDYNNSLFKDSPCPMWILDQQTLQFLVVNQAAIDLYGYTRIAFLGMKLPEIRVDGELHRGVNVADLVQSHKDETFHDLGNSCHRRKNGEAFYVHVYSQQIEFNGKNAVLAFLINDNKRVLAEIKNNKLNEDIKRQKEQLESILTATEEVVWAIRADTYNLIYINNACYNVYGYTPEQMMQDKDIFFNSIHPDDKDVFYASMQAMLSTGRSESEYRVYHKDRTIKYLRGTAHLKKADNEGFDTCSGTTIDITKLRTAEIELTKKANEIQQQNEALKEIAWIQSHKVRSEVTTILGLIPLLKYNDSSDPETQTIMEGIKTATHNLDVITREINEKTKKTGL